MKKILSLVLVFVLALSCFVACKDNDETPDTPDTPDTPAVPTYSLAIAVESVELSSRSGKKLGNNFAVVVFDKDGKIVAAAFDSTEINAPTLDESGAVVAQEIASKVESEYKKGQMATTWGEQATAFANYIKGKTAAEVGALEITNELIAGCTMVSESYSSALNLQALVVKAGASERKVTFESATADFKLGGGMNVSVAKNWQGLVEVTADCAGAVVGADGKVVATIIDSAIQTYSANAEGALVLGEISESKLALGDAYEGETPMDAGRWYNQVAVFKNTAVGKTAAEVADVPTEFESGCTIKVTGYKVVLIKAVNNAK